MLAINGGNPVIKDSFPDWPVWDKTDVEYVRDAVESGIWGVEGTRIPEFIRKYAEFQKIKHVLPVANGSVAIETALEALDIKDGDEVIVPDYTFLATAASPIRRGARIVLVDVDESTFCINPDLIEEAVTDRTRAIIPVHFGGHPADMDRIMQIAGKYGLYVVEDCSHAHGAIWNGTHVGSFGDIGTFSLQASKTLNCGEGGLIVTKYERLWNLCRAIHNAGRVAGINDYNHYLCGTNYRITELQAGLLLAQMTRIEAQCTLRDKNGKLLTALLGKIEGVTPQARDPRMDRHGYYLFTFILDADIPRRAFNEAVKAEGVPIQVEYPAVHSIECIRKKNMSGGSFPVSDRVAERSVWLYHEALLGDEESVHLIAEAIGKVIQHKHELKV